MGICTRRNFLLTICVLQLISVLERQVFDFLGYMWAPILANFLNIIFVIFGCFGTFQYRYNYIVMYVAWSVLWLAWNVFVICFYLNVGVLNRDSDLLNLGTGSVSWWEVNGSGCKPTYPTNLTVAEDPDPFRPLRPEHVAGCFLDYQYVEVLHAALQCILAVLGGAGGISISQKALKDDNSQGSKCGSGGNHTSLYSIQINPCESSRGLVSDSIEYNEGVEARISAPHLSPRPMTPRRVKRRSVISRGTMATSSLPHGHDKHASVRYNNNMRSSLRSSSRRPKQHHQNPVTRLIEQQQQQSLADSSTSNDSTRLNLFDASSSSQADLIASTPTWKKSTGHTNPIYQQNSVQSLNDDDDDDDVYNNRPSSARSSYSNYHGTRAISCYVGPGGTPAYYMAGQATAQVPHRYNSQAVPKTTSAFLNSGPPAYQVQVPLDSETVI